MYRNMCVVALGVTLLTYCNVLFARMAVYLYVFTLLAIPHFISKLEKRLRFPVKVATVAMSCVLCLYYFLHNTDEVVPYMFAFMN